MEKKNTENETNVGLIIFILTFSFIAYYLTEDTFITTVAFFVGILIWAALGIAISSFKKKYQVAAHTWELPLKELIEKCSVKGVIDVTNEQEYQAARKMVQEILTEHKIPEKYHGRYTNRETVQGYFQTMRYRPEWKQSEVVRMAVLCYQDCCEAHADDLSTESKREKATLIVNQYFTNANVYTILKVGEDAYRAEIEMKEQEELDKIERKEIQEHRKLVRYVEYHGRNKLLAILSEECKKCQEEVNKLDGTQNVLLNYGSYVSKPREASWGLAGGIAEGIAGPAAGVAAAMEVQRQNAQNKADWEAQTKAQNAVAASALLQLAPEIRNAKERLEHIQQYYNKAQTLLVKDDDKADVYFSKLEIDTPIISVSRTGTITVKVDMKGIPFTIYDDRPAIVDGSLTAHIFEGDKKIGQAIMVFPQWGSEMNTTLTGMALFCGKEGNQYHVTLSPNDLWAMERL